MTHSLYEELKRAAVEMPDQPAAISLDADISYETVFNLSEKIALGLRNAGVKAGDRVAAHIGNRYELISVYYALLGLGAVIVPVALRLSAGEITYLLNHGKVRYYLGDAAFYEVYSEVVEGCGGLETAWVLDAQAPKGKARAFSELMTGHDGAALLEPVAPDSMAAILYSSGTTGHPKGVAYSHATLHESIALLGSTLDRAAAQGSERAVGICSVVDLVSAWSLLMTLTSTRRRQPLAISTVHKPDLLLKLLRTGRVGWIGGAPSNFRSLLEAVQGGEQPVDLSQTNCVAGGDACPPELSVAFRQTFGTPLQGSYGQTETGGPVIYHPNLSDEQEPAIGWALDGVEIKIDAEPGEPGEMWIKSPAKPLGIWNGNSVDPFEDNWLYTGDLVIQRQSDDCIMFVSRLKDVMKVGGYALVPLELEQAIAQHPKVVAAAVFSIPDPELGERPIAMIQPQAEQALNEAEILKYLKGRIADYKHPRDVVFIEQLPFAPNGKLSRKKLADHYLATRQEAKRAS